VANRRVPYKDQLVGERDTEFARWLMAEPTQLVSVVFTVHGNVQGVFFRKYTVSKAMSLGIVGYVRNTRDSSVTGVLQGPVGDVERMKDWLETTGSPASRVERVEYIDEQEILQPDYETFEVHPTK
jgi:acylphosphatase